MRSRITSNAVDSPSKPQLWQGYAQAQSTEQGIRQFLSTMRRNGSFQLIDTQVRNSDSDQITLEIPNRSSVKGADQPQFTPLMKKQSIKNQTTYDILNQIYELQNRKHRNQSLLEELMRKTRKQQGGELFSFQKIMHRRKHVKRSQRCQSVAQKEIELEQMKGQLIQVRAVVVQHVPKESTPKVEKLQPIAKVEKAVVESSPEKERKKFTPPVRKKKFVMEDGRFWDVAFNKIIQNPSYAEINQIINFTNFLQVLPAQHQKYYKIYVGRGNNHMLVKGMFNLRNNWTLINALEEDCDVNFVWTQKYTEIAASEQLAYRKDILSQEVPGGFIDNIDMVLLKQAWEKIEGKTKKKIADYTNDSGCLITNLSSVKEMQVLNHQNQTITIQNHLREGNQLGDKKYLFLNLSEYCNKWEVNLWNYIPLTFHITSINDDEWMKFTQIYDDLTLQNEQKNIWIVKPGEDTNRGNGIKGKFVILIIFKVSNNINEITNMISQQNGHTYIVQKYIENPFLYQKRKFDIRCFCLVTIINGIKKVFWYRKGYLRTSSSYFSLENLESTKIHLTNDAIQNRLTGYGKFEKGNKVSFEQFSQYLQEQNKSNNTNYNFDDLYQQMRSLTKLAAQSAIGQINNFDQMLGFELYGLDFMITHDFRPLLIEFNTNPCIECGCPILTKIISGLMENLIRFVIDPLFPAKKTGNDDFNNKNEFELLLQG